MFYLSDWLPVGFPNHMGGSNNDRTLLIIQYKVKHLQHQYLPLVYIYTELLELESSNTNKIKKKLVL